MMLPNRRAHTLYPDTHPWRASVAGVSRRSDSVDTNAEATLVGHGEPTAHKSSLGDSWESVFEALTAELCHEDAEESMYELSPSMASSECLSEGMREREQAGGQLPEISALVLRHKCT